MRRAKGLTIAEALTVLVLVAILTALLIPVLDRVKMRVKIGASLERLRHAHAALEMYRNDYGGVDVFDSYESYYALGLPLSPYPGYAPLSPYGFGGRAWESPCPSSQDVCLGALGLPGGCGHIRYVPGLYDPELIRDPYPFNGNRILYEHYLVNYKHNSVVFVDSHCNKSGVEMRAPLLKKRGLAVLLSGQLVNKYAEGDMGELQWYSEPIQ